MNDILAKEATGKLNQRGSLIEFLVRSTDDPELFVLAWRIRINEREYPFNTPIVRELLENPEFDLFSFASKQAIATITHIILNPEDA